jgi:NAD(P)-dependent dehydrogenase (short-subunit alcohol dehydrogenase family)
MAVAARRAARQRGRNDPRPPIGRYLLGTFGAAFIGGGVAYRYRHGSQLQGDYARLPMRGRVVIVTGASSGIGKETARQLVKAGCNVIVACRSQQKAAGVAYEMREKTIVNGRPALGVGGQLMGGMGVVPMELDLSDPASVHRFVKEFREKYDRLDGLVNNAATLSPTLQRTPGAGHELTWATNHAGPVLLTALLLPLMQASAEPGKRTTRIVTVASRLERRGQCDPDFLAAQQGMTRPLDPKSGYDPMGTYCDTKLCNMLHATSLAGFLDPEHVTVATVTPGMVNTGLFRSYPVWYRAVTWPVRALYLRPPSEAAEGVVWVSWLYIYVYIYDYIYIYIRLRPLLSKQGDLNGRHSCCCCLAAMLSFVFVFTPPADAACGWRRARCGVPHSCGTQFHAL